MIIAVLANIEIYINIGQGGHIPSCGEVDAGEEEM